MRTTTLHRCLLWAAAGGTLGLSLVAWAQGPPHAPTTLDASTLVLVELAKAAGLPGVLAFIGFKLGRLIERLELTVRLSDEDRRLVTQALRRSRVDDVEDA